MEIKLESLSDVREFIAIVQREEHEKAELLRGVLARARRALQVAIQRAEGVKR